MDRDIKVVVEDRVATAVGDPVIICGNSDYTITFAFDDEWAGIEAKTALFKYLTADGVKKHEQPFTGDMVEVPILADTREVEVGVYAGNLTTTTGAPIRCLPCIRCGSGERVEPDPDKYDQLMDLIKGGGLDGQSAYEAAKAGGYEGTEEEFQKALADIASGGAGTGLTDEQAADLAANTKARHGHDNKNVLDLFGLNYAQNRPTFRAQGNGVVNILALIDDVIERDNDVRRETPNKATLEGSTLTFQSDIYGQTTDLFSVELPSGGAPAPAVLAAQTVAALAEYPGFVYAAFETPAVASDPFSDFNNYLSNTVTPLEEGGAEVVYAPPEDGDLVYTRLYSGEQVTLRVAAGVLYEFYLDTEEYDTVCRPTSGVGILEFFKKQLLADR